MNSYSSNGTHTTFSFDSSDAKKSMLDDETSKRLASVFKIIGDPSRVKIIYALLQSELCVGDISSVVGLSPSAVSHQLRVLRDSRLVKSRREGQLIFYSLDDHHVINLLSECLDHIQEG